MNRLLSEAPFLYEGGSNGRKEELYPLGSPQITDKGTQIMERLLLRQYASSPNLKAYFSAFIEELDLLFKATEDVYFGRFLEFAEGRQLDIIGKILQQPRAVTLDGEFFGFDPDQTALPMSDENDNPLLGGLFKDANSLGFSILPLEDTQYRRLLYVVAEASNRDYCSIEFAYHLIFIVLGYRPASNDLVIEDSDSLTTTPIAENTVRLYMKPSIFSVAEIQLVAYISKFFVPTGKILSILGTRA